MNIGHFQPFVSRRVTAMVDMHCGANTNQARKASAVGRVQPALSSVAQRPRSAASSSAVDRISRRQRADRHFARGHRRDQRQRDVAVEADRLDHDLEPVGDLAGDRASTWFSPGPACGKLSSTHSTTVTVKMIVPARRRKIQARCHRPIARSRSGGIWYLGSSMMKPAGRALGDRAAQHQRGEHRADDAGDVEREQHQPLQADARSRRCGRG